MPPHQQCVRISRQLIIRVFIAVVVSTLITFGLVLATEGPTEYIATLLMVLAPSAAVAFIDWRLARARTRKRHILCAVALGSLAVGLAIAPMLQASQWLGPFGEGSTLYDTWFRIPTALGLASAIISGLFATIWMLVRVRLRRRAGSAVYSL